MLRQGTGFADIETTEMKEDERQAIRGPFPVIPVISQRGMAKVPVCQIQPGMTQDPAVVRKTWDQVHEFLVDENALVLRIDAMPVKATLPPVDQGQAFQWAGGAKEAKIVNTRPHDRDVVGIAPTFRRFTQMRGQDERGPRVECVDNGIQRGEEKDVRVKVNDPIEPHLFKQVSKHERLYGRIEFHDVIRKGKVLETRDSDFIRRDHFEGAVIQARHGVAGIRQSDKKAEIRMEPGQRLHQHTCARQVIIRAYRKNCRARLPGSGIRNSRDGSGSLQVHKGLEVGLFYVV